MGDSLFLNSRFDSGCFVKVFVELLYMTVSKACSDLLEVAEIQPVHEAQL